jgi:hypothetical protein
MRAFIAAALMAFWFLTSQSPGAQGRRAMTIDDLLGAVRVTDPQLSPDASRVIFVRTTTDLKSGERNADIWAVPADGIGSGEGNSLSAARPTIRRGSLPMAGISRLSRHVMERRKCMSLT